MADHFWEGLEAGRSWYVASAGLDKCNGTGNVRFADIDRQMSVFFIEGDTLFVEILKCLTGF